MDQLTELRDVFGFGPRYHLREDFHFARAGDQVLIQHGDASLVVPVTEWASAIAFTSARGEDAGSYAEALAFLSRHSAPASSDPLPAELFAAAVELRKLALALTRKDDRAAAQRVADLLHRTGVRQGLTG